MEKIVRRLPKKEKRSFFLFGPRGVGKSTWLKDTYPESFRINLLDTSIYLQLQRNPNLLEAMIPKHLKSYCVIDEVQKIPALLDEVHRLIEDRGISFILSGSSARKLKRSGTNLLGGRASVVNMYPFSASELKTSFNLEHALEFGLLPLVYQNKGNEKEVLEAYVHTYLKEEIKEEGLIRKVDPFLRFLEVAGQFNAQILNIQNISREASIPRSSVVSYFEILKDTMLAHRLPAYRPGALARESEHPKFYWFDPGVARASAGDLNSKVDSIAAGYLFETLVLHELKVYNEISGKKHPLYYYRSGSEIDFVVELEKKSISRKPKVVLIECKYSKKWSPAWCKPMNNLIKTEKINVEKSCGIYIGKQKLHFGESDIFPWNDFIDALYAGKIF